MYKTGKLLKVVSIIQIVFMSLGIIASIISIATAPVMIEIMQESGMQGVEEIYNIPLLVLGLVVNVFGLATAIVGLLGKSKKVCYIMMGIYILYLIYSTIDSIAIGGVGLALISAALSLVLPILYLWGVYQSEDIEAIDFATPNL